MTVMDSGYMPRYIPGRSITFVAGAAITGCTLVKLSTTNKTVVPAGVGDAPIGVAAVNADNGDNVTVWLMAGTGHRVKTATAVAVNDTLSAAAGGLVAKAGTGTVIGRAVESAAAGQEVIFIGIGA